MNLPKIVLTDIDGVWTDGGMYYDKLGNELKKFNTSDSVGVMFCHLFGIKVGIITGEDTKIVKYRAEKVEIDYLFMGAKNKLNIAERLCRDINVELKDVAFIGDDLVDIPLIKAVGISAAPYDSPEYVKCYTTIKLKKIRGQGVFREFIEKILNDAGMLDNAIEKCLTIYQHL